MEERGGGRLENGVGGMAVAEGDDTAKIFFRGEAGQI
jgi:hypothetical protein